MMLFEKNPHEVTGMNKKYKNQLLFTDDRYLDKGFNKPTRRIIVVEQNSHNRLGVVKLNSIHNKNSKLAEGRLLPLGTHKGVTFGADMNLYIVQFDGKPIKVGPNFRAGHWFLRRNKRKKFLAHIYQNKKRPDIARKNRRKRQLLSK